MDTVFRKHVALPADHGSWAFFLGPLIIGLVAGGRPHVTTLYLVIAAGCGFLIRQPVTLVVKVLAGRRPRDTLPAARFWIAVYAAVGLLHVTGLVIRGFGYLLYLAIPGVLVFAWYLYLVYRRAERRQRAIEVLATGVMALAAPAAMWVGLGRADPLGWLLWLLVWLQVATAIFHAYLRLEQRTRREVPALAARLRSGAAALSLASAGPLLVGALAVAGIVSPWLSAPYLVQWADVLRGVARPAVGLRPTTIGFQQLAVSTLFTVLFALAWSIRG